MTAGEPPAPRRPPLALEDLGLAAWNAAAVPLLAMSAAAPVLELGETPDPLAGWIQLLAVAGALAAIATRPAGALPSLAPGPVDARLAFMGPLIGAVAFVAGSASSHLGLGIDGPVVGVAFVLIVAAMLLGDRLPTIDTNLRRLLIAPFIFVCAGIFNGFAADILGGLDVAELIGSVAVDDTGFGLFVVGMLLAGLAAFYAALVVAPRALVTPEAGAGAGCLVWPLRFVLYLASAILGIGWLAVLAG